MKERADQTEQSHKMLLKAKTGMAIFMMNLNGWQQKLTIITHSFL